MANKGKARPPAGKNAMTERRVHQGQSAGEATRGRVREIDILCMLSLLLSITLGVAASQALNADGVSYLDLANAVRTGDWANFVQGYWSPLYPLLLASTGAATLERGANALPAAHGLNVVIALAGVALIWSTFRGRERPVAARLALAAWLLCSVRPPRVDALTPDPLLTVLVLALALELTVRRGRHGLRIGVLLGAIFLAKTSTWPWIAVVLALETWRTRAPAAALRLTVLPRLGLMLLWVVPLSMKSGSPTLGSAGSLNTCWYLRECDSRTPDTHEGEHAAYRQTLVDGKAILWAEFNSAPWTYAPWSDPTAWGAGVRTSSGRLPTPAALLSYWGRQLAVGLRLWLWPVLAGVLAPALLIGWRRGAGRELLTEHRASCVAMVAGVVGVGQFFVIHAEPRLIGPYLLCLAIGAIGWLVPDVSGETKNRPAAATRRLALSYLGYVIALPFASASVRDAVLQRHELTARLTAIDEALVPLRQAGIIRPRIVIVGYALPVLTDVWRVNGRVVAQVRPGSARDLATLPVSEQQRLVAESFTGRPDVVWYAGADGSNHRYGVPLRLP